MQFPWPCRANKSSPRHSSILPHACKKNPFERDQRVRVPSEQESVTEMEELHVMDLELEMACGTSV